MIPHEIWKVIDMNLDCLIDNYDVAITNVSRESGSGECMSKGFPMDVINIRYYST